MLFQLIVGPFSTLHTLPKGMSLALLATTALISSISLGVTGVKVNTELLCNITTDFDTNKNHLVNA